MDEPNLVNMDQPIFTRSIFELTSRLCKSTLFFWLWLCALIITSEEKDLSVKILVQCEILTRNCMMPRAQRTEGIGPWMRYIRAGRGPELGRATNIFLHPGSLQLSRLSKQTSLVKEIAKWSIFRFLLGMGKQKQSICMLRLKQLYNHQTIV